MGGGADARPSAASRSVMDDLRVLKSLWFQKASGNDHKERLEHFYDDGHASSYDQFRESFLWGRKPMLAACAARLESQSNMVWVDLGGGTAENVAMMSEYIDLSKFKAIYVVDLCGPLCKVAQRKVADKGWTNVHVVEADACKFVPPEGVATLITFSYSLTMIPPFHDAIDQAKSYLDKNEGLVGVADFFVSSKYDMPLREMPWLRRFFWRSIFDTDNIDIGPERRTYLDHQLKRVWEINCEGSIPYVPYLRAPYYCWVGRAWHYNEPHTESKVEAPAMFPPTFLYTQSWEDPRPDMEVMDINEKDVCLTLTSGGCNALNLLLHGAKQVVSVDCNPAQSALLQLKQVAIQQLEYEDVWQLFGEGRHPHARELFERKLAPWLSQASYHFWRQRLHYFDQGLYYQGGMGTLCWVIQIMLKCIGMGASVKRITSARTIEEQVEIWESLWWVRFFTAAPRLLMAAVNWLLSLVLLNRFVLWYGGGVPCKQYELIVKDGLTMPEYCGRTMAGVAYSSCLRTDNYFYYNCLTGKFERDNCPAYLTKAGFKKLKAGAIKGLNVTTGCFMSELKARKYTKVILMDHIDWMDEPTAKAETDVLAQQVLPGGIVIWRSAALDPPYAKYIKDAGFDVRCVRRASEGYMDRVNMYSSFFMAVRKHSHQE